MNFRDPKGLLQVVVAFSVAITSGAFFALDTDTTIGFWTHWSLIFMAILALSFISMYTYRELVRQRRYILQGEAIANHEECGFGERTDAEDETGKIIVNLRPNWQLEGVLGRLGASGTYLANIRFKVLKPVSGGICTFTLYNRAHMLATMSIELKQFPVNRFVYIDIIFEYDGESEIHFQFEPNQEAKIPEIIGFDRLEAYYLPKAGILR